jgi:hypothetical protein
MNMSALVPEGEVDWLKNLKKKGFSKKNESCVVQRVTKAGKLVSVWLAVTLIRDEKNQLEYIATTERELSQLSTATLTNLTGGHHEEKGTERN